MIYILLLEKEKWYIGYTERKDGERFQEHFTGEGSKWTQLYKPIQVIEWREGTLEDENKITLEYMQKYGWWNVRGGSYCQVEMTKPPNKLMPQLPIPINNKSETKRIFKNGRWIKITLTKDDNQEIKQILKSDTMIEKTQTDCIGETCFNCGEDGHYSTDCQKAIKKSIQKGGNDGCNRCGRQGHWAPNCYAKTNINGITITIVDNDEDNDSGEIGFEWQCSKCYRAFETKKGALYHANFYCQKK